MGTELYGYTYYEIQYKTDSHFMTMQRTFNVVDWSQAYKGLIVHATRMCR